YSPSHTPLRSRGPPRPLDCQLPADLLGCLVSRLPDSSPVRHGAREKFTEAHGQSRRARKRTPTEAILAPVPGGSKPCSAPREPKTPRRQILTNQSKVPILRLTPDLSIFTIHLSQRQPPSNMAMMDRVAPAGTGPTERAAVGPARLTDSLPAPTERRILSPK